MVVTGLAELRCSGRGSIVSGYSGHVSGHRNTERSGDATVDDCAARMRILKSSIRSETMSLHEPLVQHVIVDGVRVPYREAGDNDSPRMPLLLVHGAGGTGNQHFAYLFSMLAFRQRVISVDLQSMGTAAGGINPWVRQTLAVVESTVRRGSCAILGYGLGAAIAASAAAMQPERVKALVLVAGWLKTEMHQTMRARVWRALRECNTEVRRAHDALSLLSQGYLRRNCQALPELGPNDLRLFEQQMDAAADVDLEPIASRIAARTLVIAGTFDQIVSKRQVQDLFGAIDDALFVEIASGHAIHLERPAELFQRVDDFMRAPYAWTAGSVLPVLRP